MNKNINLIEILKDIPDGTKLWSPLCGECEFIEILPCDAYPIRITHGKGHMTLYYNFSLQGKVCNNSDAECLLFPSKGNRNWSTFKAPWEHRHFEPFQKVLIASGVSELWEPDMYCYYNDKRKRHVCMIHSAFDNDIIPYEGNEDKVGKHI